MGFVGHHLAGLLRAQHGVELLLTARKYSDSSLGVVQQLDVTDPIAVREAVARFGCTHIVHLAGLAAVTAANSNPEEAWRVHVGGTLNIARAIQELVPECSLIFVGSGQVYGASARSGEPVDELTLPDPVDTYSVTKVAADFALGALARQGLQCIRMRPFNHTGPGQSDSFVVSNFAMQVARIEAGLQPATMRVGNLEAERDFLDVRDVASAYVSALQKSHQIAAGQIINVASGKAHSIRSILDKLLNLSQCQIQIEQDVGRMRPNDLPRIVGDGAVARKLLNWTPVYSLDETLIDLLEDCRRRVRVNV